MDQRVFLHVGLPKTGTTFVQASLARNRRGLREEGISVPVGRERMFAAAVDVRGTHKAWGRRRADVAGSWDTVCERLWAHPGVSVASHELLAAMSARRITAAMTMLRGLDVHVVVTARDPARQAAAEWQEGVRHGRRLTFEEFAATVLDEGADGDYARRYRAAQDLPAVLARWAGAVGRDKVHLLVAPPAQAGHETLWRSVGGLVGFDADRFPAAPAEEGNPSLGVDEVDVLRRVNVALAGRVGQPDYGDLVKHRFARDLLEAGRSAHVQVTDRVLDDLSVLAERWVKEIDKAGYPVHGDVHDLAPRPAELRRHPDDVDPRAQVESVTAATAELLVALRDEHREVVRLREENAALRKKRKKLKKRLRAVDAG